ncbi:archaellin/type IV pilin N-terminal domain-containing protein [Halovivax gelatinilyticus]|uniref:archaellin/type IV pilin N-terminal domain-containing protein n=1 Tax=Halovivax gelatinilyticus TaxID=2961597 RepID=UPI0020CA6D9A|nr:archaellin/type IV pilin N-terminal domain-containing protein [Halovivax gelatinilyticus]
MFEKVHSEDERGQVGIGTLIVFIAMVLVAAIAAGVLINTAGSLQSQASDTGTETQQAVANQIEVVHAYGDLNGDDVEQVNLVVKKSAGSDVIDIESMTVQWTSDETSETLELPDGDPDADGVLSSTENGEFGVTGLTTDNPTSLVDTSDRVEINLNIDHIPDQENLEGGSSATIELVDQSGAQFSYGVTVPATYDDDANVVIV